MCAWLCISCPGRQYVQHSLVWISSGPCSVLSGRLGFLAVCVLSYGGCTSCNRKHTQNSLDEVQLARDINNEGKYIYSKETDTIQQI